MLTPSLARMCYAYQQLNDIGIPDVTSARGGRNESIFRYRKKHLPEYYGGKTASGSVLAQARKNLRKERPTAVGIHQGEILQRILTMPLIPRTCFQSMHEILGDLHVFSGVFDSVVGNMTNVSRDIMEHVKYPTLQKDSYSRLSGDRKSR